MAPELPLWLFIVPAIGVPLLVIAAVIVNTEIVRSVRWRRQDELSIDRLIRTSTKDRDAFDMDVFTLWRNFQQPYRLRAWFGSVTAAYSRC